MACHVQWLADATQTTLRLRSSSARMHSRTQQAACRAALWQRTSSTLAAGTRTVPPPGVHRFTNNASPIRSCTCAFDPARCIPSGSLPLPSVNQMKPACIACYLQMQTAAAASFPSHRNCVHPAAPDCSPAAAWGHSRCRRRRSNFTASFRHCPPSSPRRGQRWGCCRLSAAPSRSRASGRGPRQLSPAEVAKAGQLAYDEMDRSGTFSLSCMLDRCLCTVSCRPRQGKAVGV